MEPAQEYTEKIRAVAQLAELSQDITWITDLPSGHIVYANRAAMAMHGLVPDDWLKAEPPGWQGLVHPGDRALIDEYYNSFAAVANDPEIKTVEFRAMTAAGTWLPLSAKGKVFDRHADGSVRAVLSMVRSITDQERAEQKTEEHRDLLQKLMDAPNVGMGVFKAVRDGAGEIQDFRFEFVNRRTLEAFQGNDPVGRLLTDYGSDGVEQLQFFKDVIHTGKANSYTRKAEAGIVEGWFLFSNAPLGDDRLVQVWEDITEIKKTEQAVKESKRLLKATIDSSPDRIHVMKAVRDEQGQITDFRWLLMNEAAVKKFGDLSGELWLKHYPGVVEEKIFDAFKQVVETGAPNQHEKHYRHEGHDMWVYQSIVKLDDGIVNTVRDISEKRKADEEIIRLKDEIAQKATDKYRTLFETMDEGYCIIQMLYNGEGKVCNWRYLEVNPAFERHNGLEHAAGKTIRELVPDIEDKWMEIYGQVAETGQSVRFEESSAALQRVFDLYVFRIGQPEDRKLAVLFADISRRKKSEQALHEREAWINGQKEAFQAAINGKPLAISLHALVRMVAQQFNGEAGAAFYMASPGEARLQLVAGVDEIHAQDANGFATGAGLLACSLAMQTGEPVIISDIETDPLWETWRHMASELGYRGCWSFPVRVKGGPVVGTFAMYFKQPRQPTPAELSLAGVVTRAASIIIWSNTQLTERSQAEKALKELNLGLEQHVERRTQELTSLKMSQDKEKLNAVIFAQEQERTRIGEGLHNGVAQLLYAVQSRLQLVRSNGGDDDKHLKASMQIISEAIHDTRRISFELMPPVLKDFGLAIALGTLMTKVFSDRIKLKMNVGLKKRLPEDLEISIYRIVQEAINNILKHAEATEADIEILESRGAVKIKIADNGKGFVPREVRKQHKGIGFQTIENRVRLLNGSLKFRSKPGEGTSLGIRLPLGPGRL